MLGSPGRKGTEGCLFQSLRNREGGGRGGLCQSQGTSPRRGLRPGDKVKTGASELVSDAGSIQEEDSKWSPRAGLGRLPQERRAGFRMQRLGFNPPTCHFHSLCDEVSMANHSDPRFPYLQRWVMITTLQDGGTGRGGGKSNQVIFTHIEACEQEVLTKCLCVPSIALFSGGD